MTSQMTNYGDLHDYLTGSYIGEATREQRDASRTAAEQDGGAGVILVSDGAVLRADDRGADEARRCYVQEQSSKIVSGKSEDDYEWNEVD